jgi:hypothetical protein
MQTIREDQILQARIVGHTLLNEATDTGDELIGIERFRDIEIGALAHPPIAIEGSAFICQQNDRDVPTGFSAFQLPAYLEATLFR